MDVMEKLIEIVCDAMESDGCIGHCNHPPCFEVERVVNALIDSGVTVQEWVSVNDMLPKDDSDVLAYSMISEESRIYPACYSNGVWFDCVFNAPATDTTTHWMKMPHPPKGE